LRHCTRSPWCRIETVFRLRQPSPHERHQCVAGGMGGGIIRDLCEWRSTKISLSKMLRHRPSSLIATLKTGISVQLMSIILHLVSAASCPHSVCPTTSMSTCRLHYHDLTTWCQLTVHSIVCHVRRSGWHGQCHVQAQFGINLRLTTLNLYENREKSSGVCYSVRVGTGSFVCMQLRKRLTNVRYNIENLYVL